MYLLYEFWDFNRILMVDLTLSFCIDRIKVGEDGYHGAFAYFLVNMAMGVIKILDQYFGDVELRIDEVQRDVATRGKAI